MGKPFGKASRRTFIRNGMPLPLTSWNSPKVKSCDYIKNLKTTAFRNLEGRFAHARYATVRLTLNRSLVIVEKTFPVSVALSSISFRVSDTLSPISSEDTPSAG
jgi:hypothetical protein